MDDECCEEDDYCGEMEEVKHKEVAGKQKSNKIFIRNSNLLESKDSVSMKT